MSLDIGNVIALITAFGAIGGLIYQSQSTERQLLQAKRQIKLQNFIEYTKRYQEIVLQFPEDINERQFDIRASERAEYYQRTMRCMRMRAYFDLCFEEHKLESLGYIDSDFWSIWEGGIRTALSKPAFQQAWSVICQDTEYGDAFEKFVSDRIPSS